MWFKATGITLRHGYPLCIEEKGLSVSMRMGMDGSVGEVFPLKDLLPEVRKKLTPPGAWTARAFATDEEGNIVDIKSLAACRWCLVGAMRACVPSGSMRCLPIREMALALGTTSVASWNDAEGRTQEEVLATLDSIIAQES